jgi:hypothetical protein
MTVDMRNEIRGGMNRLLDEIRCMRQSLQSLVSVS